MREIRSRMLAFLVLVGLLATTAPAAAQVRYSVADLMTVTSVREYVWSPDGRYLYYVSDAGDTGTWEIFRVPGEGGAPEQLTRNLPAEHRTTPIADRAEPKDNLAVSGDGRRIFFTASRYFQNLDNIYSMPAEGGTVRQHTWHDAIIQTAPAPSPDGRSVAFFDRRASGTKIYLLDLERPNAWPRLFAPGSETERHPVWSPDGSTLLFTRNGDLWLQRLSGGEARRLALPGYGSVSSPSWSPDGSRVAVTSGSSGFSQVAVIEVASGELTPVTYAHREHTSAAWSPDGRTLAFTISDGLGMSSQVAIAPADGSGEARILTTGAGIRRSPQFSPDGREITYIETTSARTADIWALPVTGGSPRRITNSMGRVDPAQLSEATEVTYAAVDNLPIPAILTRPPNFQAGRRYPAVIALHGHPTQWNHTFNVFWQHMAQLGFVVIAPNPRGSVGMGQGFHDLHVGDYGGTEFEDVMGALDYLAATGYVDMDRVATWGGSGGGYMQFVIATEAPTAVKAQMIRAPVSDWRWLAMERYVSPGRFATPTREPQRAREEFGGAYTDIPERYEERSPLNFVENVVVPQLLLQGMRDSSVPPNEARRWAARMRELGKGDLLEYVEYPDEDHSLLRYRSTVQDHLERIQRFLGTHLIIPELLAP